MLLDGAALPGLGVTLLAVALAIGRSQGNSRLVAGATAFLQMTCFTILSVALSYLLAARAGHLWDAELALADARLGLLWPAIFDAADRVPVVLLALSGMAYHSLVLQMVLCIVVLAATRRLERLRASIAAAVLSGVVTVLISGIMPALGNMFDPSHFNRLWPSVAWLDRDLVLALRDGSLRQVDLSHLTGIVSFPSYHSTLPVILVWALHPIAALRIPAAIWAALTIAATPLFGGHYAVDVLAGLLLAVVAITVTRRLTSEKPSYGRNAPA